ncbi:MAG: hypothetical protein WCR07_01985 [Verrucomicrobiota bacterium]
MKSLGVAAMLVASAPLWTAPSDADAPPSPVPSTVPAAPRATVLQREFDAARSAWMAATPSSTQSLPLVHEFCRLAYDLATVQARHADRARITRLGIDAAEASLVHHPQSAPTWYYLALNLGELARTKSLGALKLLPRIRDGLEAARTLDELLDGAGPDRTLGLLYLEAPGWPASLGSRTKAREHFLKAVALAPDYPGNHLCLADALLRWNERDAAKAQLLALDGIWTQARARLSGPRWEPDWSEWSQRRDALRRSLDGTP